jgi:hypothetical protein
MNERFLTGESPSRIEKVVVDEVRGDYLSTEEV